MSKMIIALHRAVPDVAEGERRMRRILEEITPDIARGQASYGFDARGHHLRGTLNMPASTLRAGMSLCQGKIYGSAADWAEPGAAFPDGSYALIRDNAGFVEAVSDPTASRTLWYYFDDEVFVVSNSQRAITLYVGRFEFEPAVVPWLLATGALGLGMSYNRHLRVLPPASGVLLDKAAWTLRLTEGEMRFASGHPPSRGASRGAPGGARRHAGRLRPRGRPACDPVALGRRRQPGNRRPARARPARTALAQPHRRPGGSLADARHRREHRRASGRATRHRPPLHRHVRLARAGHHDHRPLRPRQ